MKFSSLAFAPFVIGLLLIPGTAQAHHGWVDFDEKAELSVSGTVTAFYFVNPHCVVEFDVKDEKGGIQKWQGEFASKLELSRKGWNPASLEAGEQLTFIGHPSKDGSLAIHVIKIRAANGELKLDFRE
jgi:uncharacterized protein DUF6152